MHSQIELDFQAVDNPAVQSRPSLSSASSEIGCLSDCCGVTRVEAAPAHGKRRPAVDDEVRLWVRRRHDYAPDARARGVFDRSALTPEALLALIALLRQEIDAPGERQALLELTSLVLGFDPRHGADLPIGTAEESTDCAFVLDLDQGALWVDYGSILMTQAATAPVNDMSLPATTWFVRALPIVCLDALRKCRLERPEATTLSQLCGAVARGSWEPLDGIRHGRLRTTAARALRAMGPFALDLGIDRYHASLITGAPELCGRSRLYYVRSSPEKIHADTDRYFEALGLGPAQRVAVSLPFGSRIVPADEHVTWSAKHLWETAQWSRPKRRYSAAMLVAFHNACVRAWAFNFSFFLGLREVRVLDFCASRLQPGVSTMEVRDKATGRYKRLYPVYLGQFLTEQVGLIWEHLLELRRRAQAFEGLQKTSWFAHLQRALDGAPVALLFLIEGESARPAGTADFQGAIPPERRMAPNAGRHWGQTRFYEAGLSTEAIDHWARHNTAARELSTSRSVVAIDVVVTSFLRIQTADVERLGIRALPGLAGRTHRT